jgi:hypothetical protein
MGGLNFLYVAKLDVLLFADIGMDPTTYFLAGFVESAARSGPRHPGAAEA